MSGWDILNELMKSLPPIVAMLFFLAIGVIFAVGFSRHGLNFIKYGFKQTILGDSLEKRFDKLEARMDGLHVELETIKSNHFGHLKNFLTELTSILVNKGVIDNQSKARLDNQLRGM
jgi:hypothetical protein